MLNINYGKNKDLMQICQPLNEYAWLVDKIRSFKGDIEAAIVAMPNDFLIKNFLLEHKAEVKGMFLTEYDEKKVLEQERRDGMREFAHSVVTRMLKEKLPLELILKISELPKETVISIASSLNISIK